MLITAYIRVQLERLYTNSFPTVDLNANINFAFDLETENVHGQRHGSQWKVLTIASIHVKHLLRDVSLTVPLPPPNEPKRKIAIDLGTGKC